jgi:CDP-diacylglycerol--glycerol-3-phosphate 3-phosphatidyltransferase
MDAARRGRGEVAVSVPMTPAEARPAAGPIAQLKLRAKDAAHAAVAPVVAGLHSVGIRADHLTVAGLVLSLGAGFAFFDGKSRLGALLLLAGGLCDLLDGELARRAGPPSRFGAFFDSTLDRLAEAFVLLGIACFYVRNLFALVFQPQLALEQMAQQLFPMTWGVLAVTAMLALVGSFMVSYTRARAEGLGLDCRVGWFERPERLVLLIVAGALQVFWAMSIALILLTVLSFATAAQRVRHVYRITRGVGRDSMSGPAGSQGGQESNE